MRLDLRCDVSVICEKAIQEIVILSRHYHEEHENAGGYSFSHALVLAPGHLASMACLRHHTQIEDAKMSAIREIMGSSHDNAIRDVVARFKTSIAALNST